MSSPPDETPHIFAEGTWLQGSVVSFVLYGIVFVLSIMCWRSLWSRIRTHNTGYRRFRFFFCCVTFLFVVSTIFAAYTAFELENSFIKHRLYPGGPSAYALVIFSHPLAISFLLSDWCAMLMMIWRCIVVYRDTKMHIVVFVLGVIMFLSTVVIGILWLVIMSSPQRIVNNWMSLEFLFPYLCLSLATTIFISLLTVLRLLFHRRRISRIFGTGHGAIYASFAAIIVESAAIYSICSLLYLIPFALHNPLANSFTLILGQAQAIASLLIIFRVVEGKSWTNRTPSIDSTTRSPLQMLPMQNRPQHLTASTARNHLNVQITLDPETSREESKRSPQSRYSREYTGEYAKAASAPVVSAV